MNFSNRFIARQAILDVLSQCFGYELLYRNGDIDKAIVVDNRQASLRVLDSTHLLGIEALCGDSKAFVNCSREVLTGDLINLLRPARTVIEILETVIPDQDVLQACARLKDSGFMLALDDFAPGDARDTLIKFSAFHSVIV
jgi:EAL and modified HD-GYP domain-containing signal transduction protein